MEDPCKYTCDESTEFSLCQVHHRDHGQVGGCSVKSDRIECSWTNPDTACTTCDLGILPNYFKDTKEICWRWNETSPCPTASPSNARPCNTKSDLEKCASVFWDQKRIADSKTCEDWCEEEPACKFWSLKQLDEECSISSKDLRKKYVDLRGKEPPSTILFGSKETDSKWMQTKGTTDCWSKCDSKGGLCPDFCGPNGYCCREGFAGCPSGADKVSPNHHTCVSKKSN